MSFSMTAPSCLLINFHSEPATPACCDDGTFWPRRSRTESAPAWICDCPRRSCGVRRGTFCRVGQGLNRACVTSRRKYVQKLTIGQAKSDQWFGLNRVNHPSHNGLHGRKNIEKASPAEGVSAVARGAPAVLVGVQRDTAESPTIEGIARNSRGNAHVGVCKNGRPAALDAKGNGAGDYGGGGANGWPSPPVNRSVGPRDSRRRPSSRSARSARDSASKEGSIETMRPIAACFASGTVSAFRLCAIAAPPAAEPRPWECESVATATCYWRHPTGIECHDIRFGFGIQDPPAGQVNES